MTQKQDTNIPDKKEINIHSFVIGPDFIQFRLNGRLMNILRKDYNEFITARDEVKAWEHGKYINKYTFEVSTDMPRLQKDILEYLNL